MAETAWARDLHRNRTALRGNSQLPFPLPARRSRDAAPIRREKQFRTIFISDTHLGTRGCKADALADFLARHSCRTLYLVGDIVDGWRLKHRWFWPDAHNKVLEEILHKIDTGTRVIYVPGNHDEVLRDYCGREIAGVELMRETVHETADGKRLLVIHGDQFDGVIAYARWLAFLGDWAYTRALELNELCAMVRRAFGLPYWSLSAYLKQKVKNAVEYICRFETAVVDEARSRGLDGVVCGHIHHAAIKHIGGILYTNDGDWVESCTALTEDAQGNLEILHWAPSQVGAAAGILTESTEGLAVPA
ncbi:MAG TPA: UDP-2,3-diacylglucosamine diphosphatase [Rhizomicrobium sp.]|nr:UDP-2,3-diacylglucosamine diphosphatase [Rhizomicrobium sp.]